MQTINQIDPLQLATGQYIVYRDRNKAYRTGRLIDAGNKTCRVEQRITIVKQKNGHRYPPIKHRVDRGAIVGILSSDHKRTLPVETLNKRIIKKAEKNGITIDHDKMPTPKINFSFSKTICKSEAFHGFLVIAKKCELDIGDPVTIKMNGWRIKTHVQKVNRIWMTKEMREKNIIEGDNLNFDVVKQAGNTVVTVTKKEED